MSLVFILCSAFVASPMFSTVIVAWFFLGFSLERLMGISSTPGIQIMVYCPGLALEHGLSVKVRDLIVGVSVVMLVILTVRILLVLV